MKIRTDFVTNSSSSSFCIMLVVKMKDSDEPFVYKPTKYWCDGAVEVKTGLYDNIEKVAEQIRSCASIEELSSLLTEHGYLFDFEEYKKGEDEEDLSSFLKRVFDGRTIGDIQSCGISKAYYGWGESIEESQDEYLWALLPKENNDVDIFDDDKMKSALKEALREDELEYLSDVIEHNDGRNFTGIIETKVDMVNKTIDTVYGFEIEPYRNYYTDEE